MGYGETDQLAINTIRCLAIDATAKANSGHPGAPMGMAPVAHVLFNKFMRFNPKNPAWPNRDRFVLSNGHACMLQYAMLHLFGYEVSLDDLKSFRVGDSGLDSWKFSRLTLLQTVDSICPGHPEAHDTPGVEVTTGPLGQGFGNTVGLAIAQKHSEAVFNKPGFDLFTNYTYCFFGDGCMMEGIASEAASMAGHLQLGNIIAIYDDNHITIGTLDRTSAPQSINLLTLQRWRHQLRVHGRRSHAHGGIWLAHTMGQGRRPRPSGYRGRDQEGAGSD
ncbi:hypothetical protein LTR28_010070 [Elasticomyces elasticus]|nr:hypothetical protein LTR28_010070 [Elasticomyces elasticus]